MAISRNSPESQNANWGGGEVNIGKVAFWICEIIGKVACLLFDFIGKVAFMFDNSKIYSIFAKNTEKYALQKVFRNN